jgi:hypothetical protein
LTRERGEAKLDPVDDHLPPGHALRMSEEIELYCDEDVRVTSTELVAGTRRYLIREISAFRVRRSSSWPLLLGLSLWPVLLITSTLVEVFPSWLMRAIFLTHFLAAGAYMLLLVVGWSFLITALRRADYYEQKYTLSVMLYDRPARVAIKGTRDHVEAVARALDHALDAIRKQETPLLA